jgi:hypothetical protein
VGHLGEDVGRRAWVEAVVEAVGRAWCGVGHRRWWEEVGWGVRVCWWCGRGWGGGVAWRSRVREVVGSWGLEHADDDRGWRCLRCWVEVGVGVMAVGMGMGLAWWVGR